MNVLFDQNISFRILPQVSMLFEEATHIQLLGWKDYNDYNIFMLAKEFMFDLIVTLDEDF